MFISSVCRLISFDSKAVFTQFSNLMLFTTSPAALSKRKY